MRADEENAGNRIAERLVELSAPAYRLAVHLLRGSEDAEDVVQAAYLSAIPNLPPQLPPEKLRPWFLKVVANTARKHRRAENRRRKREAKVMRGEQSARLDTELVATIRGAVESLEDAQRLPVLLCCEEGLSQAEAGEVLEVSQQTLSNRLNAGLEAIRRTLGRAGYTAAPAVVAGGLQATAPVVPQALTEMIRNLVTDSAAAKAAAGTAATAAGSVALAWKFLAGLAALVLLGIGGFGLRSMLSGPRPQAAARPAAEPEAPARPGAIEKMLARDVTIRRHGQQLARLFKRLGREHGIGFFGPTRRVRLNPGRKTLGKLLKELERELGAELEVTESGDRVAAIFWNRPEKTVAAELMNLAASGKELDRCLAARWLPSLVRNRKGLDALLRLVSDKSPRVRQYALTLILEDYRRGWYPHSVDVVRLASTPKLGRTLAAEIEAIAQARVRGEQHRRAYDVVHLAGRIADPVCLPGLLKIIEGEQKKRRWRMVTRKTRAVSHGHSVYPRDPARLRDSALLNSCYGQLAAFRGPETERAVLTAFGKLTGLGKQHLFGALAALGTPKAEEALLRVARDRNKYLRNRAISAFLSRGGRDAVAKVIAIVREQEIGHNEISPPIYELARSRSPEAIEYLLERLAGEKDDAKRSSICWAICCETGAGERVLPVLEEQAESDDKNKCGAALTAMGMSGSGKAIPVLAKFLDHPERGVASRASLALARIGGEPATCAILAAKNPVRFAQALGDLADPAALPLLRKGLEADDPWTRIKCARALGHVGTSADVGGLVSARKIEKTPLDGYLQESVMRSLGQIGGKRAAAELVGAAREGKAPAIRALLDSDDPDCRRAAGEQLRERGRQMARGLLALDTSRSIRKSAALYRLVPHVIAVLEADGLAIAGPRLYNPALRLGDPRQVESLVGVLRANRDPQVRARAPDLMAKLLHTNMGGRAPDPACVQALLRALQEDDSPAVRKAALGFLKTHSSRTLESARRMMAVLRSDDSAEVRQAAAKALGARLVCLAPHIAEMRERARREAAGEVRKEILRVLKDWEKYTEAEPPKDKPQPEVF